MFNTIDRAFHAPNLDIDLLSLIKQKSKGVQSIHDHGPHVLGITFCCHNSIWKMLWLYYFETGKGICPFFRGFKYGSMDIKSMLDLLSLYNRKLPKLRTTVKLYYPYNVSSTTKTKVDIPER